MPSIERKLTTILAADVVSFSKMMGEDEVSTLNDLKSCREIIDASIHEHHGRIFGSAGDSVIAEFGSPVQAVFCALEFLKLIGERNAHLADHPAMQFRVGINIGDVIIDNENLYGDGVNVAARLESIANPGNICISRKVFDEVKRKIDVIFVEGGQQHLKNIDEPVSVYHIEAAVPSIGGKERATPGSTQASGTKSKTGATTGGFDKPSIAVLPFTNLSTDPEQGFFADGITEDIITALSRFPTLVVIARNSSFMYKDKSVNVTQVGQELGARYVVEGSVRKAGNRIRVTVQMIEASTGEHIWAERYDRELHDIFELQDELSQSIVATLPGRLESAEMQHLIQKPPEDMAAYDYLLAAKIHHHKFTKKDNSKAMELLNKAIELDPRFAPAHAWKACVMGQAIVRGYSENRDNMSREALKAVETAYKLDENDVEANRILCEVAMHNRDWSKAKLHQDRALRLNPNDPRLVAQRGELLTWLGQAEEGLSMIEKAMRLDPYDAQARAHLRGRALFVLRRYDAAIEAYKMKTSPRADHIADLAACYAQLGNETEARAQIEAALKLNPALTISSYLGDLLYCVDTDRQHHIEALRKAGLPE
jgi:adenylate cyclase